jgi:hypothetical protein
MQQVAVARWDDGGVGRSGTDMRADTNNTTYECANQRDEGPRRQAASPYMYIISLSRCDARLVSSSPATSLAAGTMSGLGRELYTPPLV